MGLGLALVKSHVTALCGEVSVVSTVGAGSVFTVRLPGAAVVATPRAAGDTGEVPARPAAAPSLAEIEQ
jgi:hypothetical protein